MNTQRQWQPFYDPLDPWDALMIRKDTTDERFHAAETVDEFNAASDARLALWKEIDEFCAAVCHPHRS